jgi:rubrerythrin
MDARAHLGELADDDGHHERRLPRLALERTPELVEDREVGVRRAANRHGPMLVDRLRPTMIDPR